MQRTDFPFKLGDLLTVGLPVLDGAGREVNLLRTEDASNLTLVVGLTDRCNLRCPKCYYRESPRITACHASFIDLDLALLQELLDDAGKFGQVMIGAEGEPLCHPEFIKALKLCGEHAHQIIVVSNGHLLNEASLKAFSALSHAALMLSCDGSDAVSYGRLHPGGSFDRFCCKAAEAVRVLDMGRVIMHSIISSGNIDNLVALPALCHRLGIGTLSLALLREHPGSLQADLKIPAADALVQALRELGRQARHLGIVARCDLRGFAASLRLNLRDQQNWGVEFLDVSWPCQLPWHLATLLCDGRLFACCGDFAPASLGAGERMFSRLFNHEGLLRLRGAVASCAEQGGALPGACRICLGIPDRS